MPKPVVPPHDEDPVHVAVTVTVARRVRLVARVALRALLPPPQTELVQLEKYVALPVAVPPPVVVYQVAPPRLEHQPYPLWRMAVLLLVFLAWVVVAQFFTERPVRQVFPRVTFPPVTVVVWGPLSRAFLE